MLHRFLLIGWLMAPASVALAQDEATPVAEAAPEAPSSGEATPPPAVFTPLETIDVVPVPAPSAAPPAATAAPQPRSGEPWLGGWGHLSFGMLIGTLNGAGPAIEHAIGRRGAPTGPAWLLGGGGKAMLWGFVLGGKGFGFFYPEGATPLGGASVSGGGGGLDVGYAVYNQDGLMLHPFVGVGGLGLDVRVHNTSNTPLEFGSGGVPPGQSRAISGTAWYLEGGVGAHWFPKDGGSPAIGAELGVMVSFESGDWTDQVESSVNGLPAPGFVGAYLKIDGGGGGFFTYE